MFSDERHKPDAPVELLYEPVPVPFEHDQFLEDAIADRGDQPSPFCELLFERAGYFRCCGSDNNAVVRVRPEDTRVSRPRERSPRCLHGLPQGWPVQALPPLQCVRSLSPFVQAPRGSPPGTRSPPRSQARCPWTVGWSRAVMSATIYGWEMVCPLPMGSGASAYASRS